MNNKEAAKTLVKLISDLSSYGYSVTDYQEAVTIACGALMNEETEPNLTSGNVDVAAILRKVSDAVRFTEIMKTLPDCKTCVKRNCEYMPKYGNYARINCPL